LPRAVLEMEGTHSIKNNAGKSRHGAQLMTGKNMPHASMSRTTQRGHKEAFSKRGALFLSAKSGENQKEL